jgi:L-aspartate oxidase
MHRHDVLILGSGLAALTTALKLADQRRVAIVTKRQMTDGASDWAQGGIAAAVDSGTDRGHVHDIGRRRRLRRRNRTGWPPARRVR